MKILITKLTKLKIPLIAALLLANFLNAQTKTISGVVTGDGLPLPGTSITIEGQETGAITDFDGLYTIEAAVGQILEFKTLGFKNQRITVAGNTRIDVSMVVDISSLEEVVVVGYGTLERKELTGSQVSLKAEDIDKIQAVSFEEALQGKASGVLITASQGGPGDAARIQIRGATSINASSAPLYVIDGVEIDGDPLTTGNGLGGAQSSPLSLIDPANIQSVEILKDANATAIYGSRGSNGVVIVKTKSGKGVKQKLIMELDMTTGIQTISNHIDLLGVQDYVDHYNDSFPWNPADRTNVFQQKAFRDNNGKLITLDDVKTNGKPRFGVRDWRDEVFRDALIQKYSLAVRKGSADSWFSGNLSYTDQEGIVKNTDYQRIQASLNVGGNVNERLQVGVQASGGRSSRSGVVTASPDQSGTGSAFGVITNLAIAPPIQGRIDKSRVGEGAGNVTFDESGFVTSNNGRIITNPQLQVNETVNNGFEIFGYTSAYLEYKIIEGLKFKSSVSFNFYQNKGRSYYPKSFGWGSLRQGIAFLSEFTQQRWQNNNTLTYNKLFNKKHKLNIVLGTSVLRNEARTQNTDANEFESDSVNLDDLSAASNVLTDTNRLENGLLGLFGRLNYSFDKRYVLSITARADKSSRFFPGSTQWGFFPSAGITWNASEESIFDDVNFLSNLRFKASVGQSGNDKIGVFQSTLSFNSERQYQFRGNRDDLNAAAVRNGSRDNAFFLNRVSNPNLTWETTTQYDIGGELGLFKNRINIGVDVFQKETRDLLLERPTASQSGFAFVLENTGEVQNRGLEISFNTVNIDTKDFSWKTDFNISYIKNEVVSLGDQQKEFTVTSSVARSVSNDFIVREGSAIGSIYGFVTDGVYNYSDFEDFEGLSNAEAKILYSTDPDSNTLRRLGGDTDANNFNLKEGVTTIETQNSYRPGKQKIKDISGPSGIPDGIIDSNDLTIIGDVNPDHFGGVTNTFRYKSWDLSVAMNWKYGNDIYNKNYFAGLNPNEFSNKYGLARNRWTTNNINTKQHSVRGRVLNEGFATNSDYVEDGSFLRLQNITLGYKLPLDVIKKVGLSSLRLYVAADNLYVWTNYSGYDPDVSVAFGQNAGLTQGVDFDAYPKARSFRFGIKTTF